MFEYLEDQGKKWMDPAYASRRKELIGKLVNHGKELRKKVRRIRSRNNWVPGFA